MSKPKLIIIALLALFLFSGSAMAQGGSISAKISGPGALNDSTIKAGENFSIDILMANDSLRRGMSFGFRLYSDDIKNVVHVADSGNGVNDLGDIKGHNGWENKSVWDFTGLLATHTDWDGKLPDTIGFAGVVIKQRYNPHPLQKNISIDLIVPEEGTLVFDSSFFPPGGKWKYDNNERPAWGGPYKFKVIK
ncbi:MAG: hypothetical protein PHU88_08215 [candidate division Zixibacteria bacterium]|nr:hypothetical protein [candidate division Zixibacteria bacterium]MDD5426829.1 hypothetical protein [candidate division Zixibacteria bacterium]